ncbi:hypothetical protein SKAU_G00137770 [Synaphobranchus kaupii]|uniref:Helitron helicase-like domain-containing protein n=1 Tax=Synaphobranchus kaupii TaxID=118154 RepID=A0A9Q1FRN6_SYNKA|nr:hypothetical protein SKAU_G00137770 [Synaphobranchus kaupii]
MKVEALLPYLLKHDILGHVDAYVMVKETQKRHLPHIHMLLTMVPRDKPRTSADIDRVVSAEIPNKDTNPELHRIVTSHMIHGPCGEWNNASPCMADRKCTKDYPKVLREKISFSDDSYPLYRRRTEAEPGAPIMKRRRQRTAQNLVDSGPPATTLTAFFNAMTQHPDMRHVVYPDVFQHFTYLQKRFQLRKKRLSSQDDRMADTVGRLPLIAFNPHTAELYYLRILLYRVPGPTCFQDLRRVGNRVMETYLAACIAHGIVDNDQEVNSVMEEAANITFGPAVREVFANMLMFILRGEHLEFWERHKRVLCEDLMHAAGVNEPDEGVVSQVLLELKDHVERHGFTLSENFGLPEPDPVHVQPCIPRVIQHETEHNIPELEAHIAEMSWWWMKCQ